MVHNVWIVVYTIELMMENLLLCFFFFFFACSDFPGFNLMSTCASRIRVFL